jgi:ferredoxin like protein
MTEPLLQKVEEKLYQNRYVVDSGKPHITVKEHIIPSPELKSLVTACPAGCYSVNDSDKVEIATDGCFECGTCRIITSKTQDIAWDYPRGGYGVAFKFG